ncbi:MAG: type VI secretion system contractile sheath small subunit [Myroides odoratus]|jgi:hypothetical protein|nr:type VI secretion system contractile sheath small subunit [Myroides odoratus]
MRLFNQLIKAVKTIAGFVDAVTEQKGEVQQEQFHKKGKRSNDEASLTSAQQRILDKKRISINLYKDETMTMFNYGVGGNEIKVDANEAIQEIQGNKSLLVAKLTTEDAISPEIVTGLKTVEEVFNYYSPRIEMEHNTPEGETVKEEFRFKNLGDFTPKKMIENSPFLKGLKVDEEQYNKLVKQLRVNKVLRKLVEDKVAKKELAATLRTIAKELEQ